MSTSDQVITIIIPTYRRPYLLRRAIESVLRQTYPYLRICVYDNSSGDETAEIVQAMAVKDNRLRYHCHSENIGHAANFQFGLKQVATPFFAFLSDDDVLLPGCYQEAIQGFGRCPGAGFVANRVLLRDEQGRVLPDLPRWRPGIYHPPTGLLEMLGNQPVWTGTVFQAGVLEKVGYLDLDVSGALDADFLFRIAAHFSYVYNDEIGAVYSSRSMALERGVTLFERVWPSNFKMIQNIVEDERLPLDVRRRFGERLDLIFRKVLFLTALRYLYQRRVAEATAAAAMLKERYPKSTEAALLPRLVTASKRFRYFRSLLGALVNARLALKRMMSGDAKQRYGEVMAYLPQLEKVAEG